MPNYGHRKLELLKTIILSALWFHLGLLCFKIQLFVKTQSEIIFVYMILYRRARAWPSARVSNGILHTKII